MLGRFALIFTLRVDEEGVQLHGVRKRHDVMSVLLIIGADLSPTLHTPSSQLLQKHRRLLRGFTLVLLSLFCGLLLLPQ